MMVTWPILYWRVFLLATPLILLVAALLPLVGFCLAYGMALLLCRSHQICRTIGVETGSQNMPVALSIILLSFPDPQAPAAAVPQGAGSPPLGEGGAGPHCHQPVTNLSICTN